MKSKCGGGRDVEVRFGKISIYMVFGVSQLGGSQLSVLI